MAAQLLPARMAAPVMYRIVVILVFVLQAGLELTVLVCSQKTSISSQKNTLIFFSNLNMTSSIPDLLFFTSNIQTKVVT